MKLFFLRVGRKHPMTVQEFKDLAVVCEWKEALTWRITDKQIAAALEEIPWQYKWRLLAVKGKPPEEWANIEGLPRADDTGKTLRSPQGRIEAIRRAFSWLACEVRPFTPAWVSDDDIRIRCPACESILEIEIKVKVHR